MTNLSFETLDITPKENYLIVQLDRGKANPINQQMVSDLRQLLEMTSTNEAVDGLILTGKTHFFTAGVDIISLYHGNQKTVKTFWHTFNQLLKEMSEFAKPLVTAITGHSPAGGCIFALCSDYRVMAKGEKYRIGLNEVPVGLIIPPSIFHLYAFSIGRRQAYKNLLEGKLMSPNEAMAIGLVDEIVPLEEVLAKAESIMQKYCSFDKNTWRKSKSNMKADLNQQLDLDFDTALVPLLEQWWSPETQEILAKMVAQLTKR